jgi:peptide/nickel transport system permease protein
MGRFIIRRLLAVVVLLVVVSMVTFAIFFMVPANPAVLYSGRSASPEQIEATERKLGLDKPKPVQYLEYMKGIVAGRTFASGPDVNECPRPCFGFSFQNQQAVWDIIKDRAPVTFSLAIGAAILWLISGLAIGILSALRRGSIFDRAAMTVALAGVSLPIFWTGLIALALFSYTWEILPAVDYVPITDNPISWARNLILPWVCLAFLYSALYARLTRATMLETLGEDYIRTARAKGLKESRVIGKHGLRATLTPIVTIFGLDVGQLLGGAVITEKTFGFRGIGAEAVDAIDRQDLPIVLGVTLFAAFFVVMMNLVVDVAYAFVDPRVRLS